MADRYASLKQGLVGAWIPSISGSGLLLPDVSGRGNHGVLTNMAADDWVSGQYGRALDFDGVDDVVTCASVVSGNLSQLNATITCWAKLVDASAFACIIAKRSNSGVFPQWQLTQGNVTTNGGANASKKIGIFWYKGGAINNTANNQCFHTTNDVVDGNWHHIALRRTNGTVPMFFIDGIAVAVTAVVNGTTNIDADHLTDPITIGSSLTSGLASNLNGQIDDIRIYNRAVTESEIRLLASRPGIGLRQKQHRQTFYQFPSGVRRRLLLTGQT